MKKLQTAKVKKKPTDVLIDNPNTAIPKLCNRINLAKDEHGNVIMTLIFVDPLNQSHILIDRVLLDKGHAALTAELFHKFVS